MKLYSSNNETNEFLKSYQAKLNSNKNKKSSNSTNKKNNNLELKLDINLNNLKNYLFNDNSKKINKDEPIKTIKLYKKLKSSNYELKIPKFTNFIKKKIYENYKDENKKDDKNLKKQKCKSKEKSKNNLEGKETKIFISHKRNQSTNVIKIKLTSKNTTKNINSNITNLKFDTNNENII